MGTSVPASKYDVFLSFRGEDPTRRNFTNHLHDALRNRGIKTHINDPELDTENISEELSRAIEESRISIVVLSTNYASSNWCLDQLEKILEYKNTRKEVMPIFREVDPSEVRNQTGRLAAPFKKLEERYEDDPDKVRKWKAALTELSNLAGWDTKGRCESDLIKEIVEDIWQKLHPGKPFPSPSQVAENRIDSSQKCDVFISFRGKDTRLNFRSHLYDYLTRCGISTYRDDKHLKRGKVISSELKRAIKEAKICLVIVSPNFPSSRWCMDELSEILQTRNRGDRCQGSELRLFINFNGEWTNVGYVGGKTKGVCVSKDITYGELEDRAYHIVGVDPNQYKIIMKAKYETKHPTNPVAITGDDDLVFFISEKSFGEGVLRKNSFVHYCRTTEG